MQLLADKSYEGELSDGLGLISGKVEKLPKFDSHTRNLLKVPNIGWRKVSSPKNNESIIVIKYPNLKSNIISLKEFFETFNFSIVQILFHVERSTAVGIHPIKAIINKMLFLSLRTGLIKLSETSVGPFTTQTINADKVLKSKIDDINLIMSSKMTYLPKKRIKKQTTNNKIVTILKSV